MSVRRDWAASWLAVTLVLALAGGCSEPSAEPEPWATVFYTGAREGTWEVGGAKGQLMCTLEDGMLTIYVSKEAGSSSDELHLVIDPFDGQVAQELDAWDMGSYTGVFLDVDTLFSYGYGLDHSRITGDEFWSRCEGEVRAGEAARWGRASGHLVCTDLAAEPLSSDYLESPEDRQPWVDLVLDFDCELEVIP